MITNNSISSRIKHLRERLNLNQKQFASSIGVSPGNVSDWEKGRSKPTTSALTKISTTFNISSDWILLGHGPGPGEYEFTSGARIKGILREFVKERTPSYNANEITQQQINQIEELLNIFMELDDDSREKILQIAKAKKEGRSLEQPTNPLTEIYEGLNNNEKQQVLQFMKFLLFQRGTGNKD